MDNAFDLGAARLINAIKSDSVRVLSLFFPRLGHSLILDTRHTSAVPPAILVEPVAGSPEARLQSFTKLRPELPLPDQLAVAPWHGSTRALVETGVYDAILDRWRSLDYPAGEADVARALHRLARLERATLRDLLSGATGRTLWQRDG